jgi:hypothetical protein
MFLVLVRPKNQYKKFLDALLGSASWPKFRHEYSIVWRLPWGKKMLEIEP